LVAFTLLKLSSTGVAIHTAINGYLRRLCEKILAVEFFLFGMMVRLFAPIRKDKLLFLSFQGDFTCNPKYIAQQIIAEKLPCEIVWGVPDVEKVRDNFPPEIRLVKRNSFRFIWEACTAGIWIENGLHFVNNRFIRKRPGQVYLQPLHGSLGIKKQGRRGPEVTRKADRITDYCISNSTFENDVYRGSYWPTAAILEYGHPRSDILMTRDEAIKEQVREKVRRAFGITFGERILLYGPTFREAGDEPLDTSCYDVDFLALKLALERRFGGTWVIFRRLHTTDARRKVGRQFEATPYWVVNATSYPDMQELMLAADAGLTDYSSWIYDYVLSGRPGFIFATDLEKYNNDWGLYYPLETTPFPIATSNEQLKANVLAFDEAAYRTRAEDFIKGKGCFEDGQASRRVVAKIRELLGKSIPEGQR
jgi:CDP-glycerol glycerophosphotransferase